MRDAIEATTLEQNIHKLRLVNGSLADCLDIEAEALAQVARLRVALEEMKTRWIETDSKLKDAYTVQHTLWHTNGALHEQLLAAIAERDAAKEAIEGALVKWQKASDRAVAEQEHAEAVDAERDRLRDQVAAMREAMATLLNRSKAALVLITEQQDRMDDESAEDVASELQDAIRAALKATP